MGRFIFGLVIGCMLMGGCSLSVGNGSTGGAESADELPLLRAIDVAGGLRSAEDRRLALRAIAERLELSVAVQVHLVDIIFDRVKGDVNREALLVQLIDNPEFEDAAQQEIIRQMARLKSNDVRRDLLRALGLRAHLEKQVM